MGLVRPSWAHQHNPEEEGPSLIPGYTISSYWVQEKLHINEMIKFFDIYFVAPCGTLLHSANLWLLHKGCVADKSMQ